MLSDRRLRVATPGVDRRYVAVAQILLEKIRSGVYQIGSRLPSDREIALATGVSRATVREALLVLELLGVVETALGAGVYVSSISLQLEDCDNPLLNAPADLVETRILVEPVIASLCAQRISVEGLHELDDLVDQAEVAATAPDPFPHFSNLGLAFHAALASHCGNQILGGIGRQLAEANEHPLWVLLNQSVVRSQQERLAQVEHHRTIIGAIRAGDGSAAAVAMTVHLDELASLTAVSRQRRDHPRVVAGNTRRGIAG